MIKSRFVTTSLIALAAFILGAGLNNIALSDAVDTNGIKIAVVDVNSVISSSSQVKALQKQQEAKRTELEKWLKVVREDVAKQSTEEGKIKLAKKYDGDLAKKQETNRNEYVKKITEIDADISKIIAQSAQANGYDIVFAKSSVLYGGDDLTQAVKKAVK